MQNRTHSPLSRITKVLSFAIGRRFKNISDKELNDLTEPRPDPEKKVLAILYAIGIILTPLTLYGALNGYKKAYERILEPRGELPALWPLPPVIRLSMVLGALKAWFGLLFLILLFLLLRSILDNFAPIFWGYVLINFVISFIVVIFFNKWQAGIYNYFSEKSRHGTARFIREDELDEFHLDTNQGLYMGGAYVYPKRGHVLTVAGTRGGKGTGLIIPNLLGLGGFQGSWVVIDPKGENAAITARYQREQGQKVRIINPWGLLDLESDTYNPFDLISDPNSLSLADDADVIAEMIVPTSLKGDENHWDNRARSWITGILVHISTLEDKDKLNAETLWRSLRLPPDEWEKLIEDMAVNDHPIGGEITQGTANEMMNLMEKGSREYASIISTAQRYTDIFKSQLLRKSMQKSSFDVSELSQGQTTLYVIIPSDKLKTHYQWLRLVVTTTMRAVIRNPNKNVCFLLDEFYALGYLSEIEIALGTYAGYGVTLWPILQSFVQLQDLYDNNWENFIANAAVRHMFSMNDKTSTEYVSALGGTTSIPSYSTGANGPELSGATARPLVTPEEVRTQSEENVFCFIDQKPIAQFPKLAYYQMEVLEGRYDDNPYFKEGSV